MQNANIYSITPNVIKIRKTPSSGIFSIIESLRFYIEDNNITFISYLKYMYKRIYDHGKILSSLSMRSVMKTLPEKQLKVIRKYATTLNMKAQAKRFGWSKEQAINKVKEYVCSGSALSINEYFSSQNKQ